MEMGKFTDKKSFQRHIYDLHIIYSTDIYCNVFSSTAGFFFFKNSFSQIRQFEKEIFQQEMNSAEGLLWLSQTARERDQDRYRERDQDRYRERTVRSII